MTDTNQPQQDEPEYSVLRDLLADMQMKLGLNDEQWLEKFGNKQGLYGLFRSYAASRPSPHALVGGDLFDDSFGEWLETHGVTLEQWEESKGFQAIIDLNKLKPAIDTLRSRDIAVAELRGRQELLEELDRETEVIGVGYPIVRAEHIRRRLEGIQKGESSE